MASFSDATYNAPSRVFLLATAIVACLLVGTSFVIARRQWFAADDFTFFTLIRLPINWLGVFLPLGHRWWWSYRPLTTDVFFSLGFWLFGHEPFGYLAISLAAHFLAAPLVYRLARQMGFFSVLSPPHHGKEDRGATTRLQPSELRPERCGWTGATNQNGGDLILAPSAAKGVGSGKVQSIVGDGALEVYRARARVSGF